MFYVLTLISVMGCVLCAVFGVLLIDCFKFVILLLLDECLRVYYFGF